MRTNRGFVKIVPFIFFFLGILGNSPSLLALKGIPALLPFQGRLTDTSGNPINYPVNVKFRIYPPSGTCYIYEDTQNISPNSFGVFSTIIGAGTSTGPANALISVFENDSSVPTSDSCASTYTPAVGDWRRLEIVVDGVAMTEMQTIGASAYAMSSQYLGGKTADDFVLKTANVTQNNLETLVDGSDASSLHNHDGAYVKASGSPSFGGNISSSGNIYLPTGGGSLGIGTSSTSADLHIKKNDPAIRLEGNPGGGGSAKIDFYGGTNLRGRIVAAEGSDGLKLYSGANLGLTLDASANALFGASVKTAGTLSLGQYDPNQEITLSNYLSSLGTTATGTVWVNSSINRLKYWDGTNILTLADTSTVVNDITAGNGVSIGGTATNPTVSVLYGSTANTAIQGDASFAGDVSGTYGAISVDRIKGTPINMSISPNSGEVLKWNGTSWSPSSDLGMTSISSSDVTTALGYTPINRGGDTMTGLLTLSGDPSSNLHSATKQYVDSAISSAGGSFIKKDGTVAFTGDQSMGSNRLTNVTNPTDAQDAATKSYVDSNLMSKALPSAPGAGQDTQSLRWNNGSNAWEYYTPSTGSVTSVSTGSGLSGGTITSSGTISLASVANNSLLANISGGSSAPSATTLTALIDSAIGNTQGSVLYRNSSGWTSLAPGTSGQFLQTKGTGADPTWGTATTTDSTKVAKAGDTMTGTLNLANDGLVVGTTQLVVSGGKVGIGTASPGQALEVVGTVKATDLLLTSDRKYKEEIRSLSTGTALEKICRLNPVSFSWKANGERDTGFIAQELREVFPEFVIQNSDNSLAIKYSSLFSPLVLAANKK